jgi:formylglycine-generating enzyme required for sulfatase activity
MEETMLWALFSATILAGVLTGSALAQPSALGRSFRDCANGCPEMVVVPQGRFNMGSPAGKKSENPTLEL